MAKRGALNIKNFKSPPQKLGIGCFFEGSETDYKRQNDLIAERIEKPHDTRLRDPQMQ